MVNVNAWPEPASLCAAHSGMGAGGVRSDEAPMELIVNKKEIIILIFACSDEQLNNDSYWYNF